MSSREKILGAVKKNQPPQRELPVLNFPVTDEVSPLEKFITVLTAIGGVPHVVTGFDEIETILKESFDTDKRVVSRVPAIHFGESVGPDADPHELEDVELAILYADLAVAENAAIWVTDEMLQQRVLPFITQNLAVVIRRESIVPMMLQAYEKIGNAEYGFGVFIAGPSKTADIEQSLVLGAHGSKTMRVFIV